LENGQREHEMFSVERRGKSVKCTTILLVGLLDMIYAFLLFWPANGIPIWLMISLLQMFIPLNTFIRASYMNLRFNKVHYAAGGIILLAVVINLLGFAIDD
jgi:hypothetical protein